MKVIERIIKNPPSIKVEGLESIHKDVGNYCILMYKGAEFLLFKEELIQIYRQEIWMWEINQKDSSAIYVENLFNI